MPGNLFGSERAVHDLDNVRRFDVSRDRAKQQQDSGMRRRNATDHEQHLEHLISGHGELAHIPPTHAPFLEIGLIHAQRPRRIAGIAVGSNPLANTGPAD